MTSDTEQIYDLKEPAAQATTTVEISAPPAPLPHRAPSRRVLVPLRRLGNVLTWAMVAVFIVGGATHAFRSGMSLRREIWQNSRSIRFKEDISRGFRFGDEVMRFAEGNAQLEPQADALADQTPAVLAKAGFSGPVRKDSPGFRRLTAFELMDGLVKYVDFTFRNHQQNGDNDYDLDYPPLRLATMTLWVRSVQRLHPEMNAYPMDRTEDGGLRQEEDVAEPVLKFNAYCAAAAAVAIFFLVWLWVHRSFKPVRPVSLGGWWKKPRDVPELVQASRPLSARWTVPHGIFAFMIACGGFWYAYSNLVHFPARPAPVVAVNQIQPGDGSAVIVATINAQNQDTQWHADFGPSAAYGHSSDSQSVETSLDDQQVSIRLQPLKSGEPVHFRIAATSAGGTTSTEDFSFVNKGGAININGAPIGGIDWPSWSVWLRLLVIFIAMVVSAQMLPPIHRGWACGAVAAMLVWYDPVVLIDSHAWPQWDVWILPFFLFAALLASLNCWMLAGMLLGIGCMFKGQLLLGGPILILWPLFEGRWRALARIVIGSVAGAELVTWPWLVNSAAGLKWIEAVAVAAGLVLLATLMRGAIVRHARRRIIGPIVGHPTDLGVAPQVNPDQDLLSMLLLASATLAALTISMALIFHGVISRRADLPAGTLGIFAALVLVVPWFIRRRSLPIWLAAVVVSAVWISSMEFNGSYSWATLGFAYGSVKHDLMQMSIRNFSNLTSLLGQSYQWDIHQQMGTLRFHFVTPGPWRIGRFAIPSVAWAWSADLDVKNAMAVLYGICLLISSAAAALHSRRNDRRFLVALVVPWMVFPVVMCQMGDRYPIWASAISAAMVAVSLELTLLHVVFASLCFAMVAHQLGMFDQNRWPQLFQLMTPTFPGVGWMLIFIAAIFLVAAVIPSRKWGEKDNGFV